MTRQPSRRRGATVVESALVLSVFLMVLFGLLEYCRFLMVLHAASNAARDGARYAAVNANSDPTQAAALKAAITGYTTDRMGGVDRHITGCQVAVYPCDPAGFAQNPSQVVPKSLTPGTPADPFNPADANNPPWNSAAFTERIAVTIRGTYRPITPLFVFSNWLNLYIMPDNIPITVTAVMGSEG
jgi:Flp pilus assembly protein TadG